MVAEIERSRDESPYGEEEVKVLRGEILQQALRLQELERLLSSVVPMNSTTSSSLSKSKYRSAPPKPVLSSSVVAANAPVSPRLRSGSHGSHTSSNSNSASGNANAAAPGTSSPTGTVIGKPFPSTPFASTPSYLNPHQADERSHSKVSQPPNLKATRVLSSKSVDRPPCTGLSIPGLSKCPRKEDEDPYERMVANMDRLTVFDEALLQSIYNKPYTQLRNQGAAVGGGLAGIASLPWGPIGMASTSLLGAIVGGLLGICADRRRRRKRIAESELEKRRLKSLVRWAAEKTYTSEDEVLRAIEMVALEFKPVADVADGSKNARKVLTLLDAWVGQKWVARHLWVYMDRLFQKWQELSRGEFVKSILVFHTLTTMYKYSPRVLDEQEESFVARMAKLMSHSSVQSVMAHAQQFPTDNGKRVMECMVFADHARQASKRASKHDDAQGHKSPSLHEEASSRSRDRDVEAGMLSDTDSDRLESYNQIGNGQNVFVVPPREAGSQEVAPAPVEQARRAPPVPIKVLKKPFFKNWDDFMEFDTEFKHKMPITVSERNLLLDKDKEDFTNWDVCIDKPDMQVAKVSTGTGCLTIRAWATVPGVNIFVAFYLFADLEQRAKWEKVFEKWRIVESDCQGSIIMSCLMKIPATTTREFVQYRRAFMMDDGAIVIVLRSAEHACLPEGKGESKGAIRVESYISGYVLRQVTDDQGQQVLKIFLMTCSDVKGLIPKWIINYVAPKKPGEWIDALRSACLQYQTDHPGCEATLKEYCEKASQLHPFDYEIQETVEEMVQATAANETDQKPPPKTFCEGAEVPAEVTPFHGVLPNLRIHL